MDRYSLISPFRRLFWSKRSKVPADTFIFIAGAPCVGKTTLSRDLSRHLQVPTQQTDTYLVKLQKNLTPEQAPGLFTRGNLDASAYYSRYDTPDAVAKDELQRSEIVANYLANDILLHNIAGPVIFEGLAVTPALVQKVRQEFPNTYAILLHDEQSHAHADRIRNRGLFATAQKYPDKFHELEAAAVETFQEIRTQQWHSAGLPVIEVSNYHDLEKRSLDALRIDQLAHV